MATHYSPDTPASLKLEPQEKMIPRNTLRQFQYTVLLSNSKPGLPMGSPYLAASQNPPLLLPLSGIPPMPRVFSDVTSWADELEVVERVVVTIPVEMKLKPEIPKTTVAMIPVNMIDIDEYRST